MPKKKSGPKRTLPEKYPPSEPCSCEICLGYCVRPGWWTVEQAAAAIEAGYGSRMMLEVAPELTFGALSPAFKGCERAIATNQFARNGCTFLKNNLCELYGSGHQPLECRFCHHDLRGGRRRLRRVRRARPAAHPDPACPACGRTPGDAGRHELLPAGA